MDNNDHKISIENQREQNKYFQKFGSVRLDKLYHRFSNDVRNNPSLLKWKKIRGYKNVNVTSSSQGIWKTLSPHFLEAEYNEEVVNFNQLYKWVRLDSSDMDIDGEPTYEFLQNREKWLRGYDNITRRSMKRSEVLYFLDFEGKKMSYQEGRKKYFCELYSKHIIYSDGYKKLINLIEDGYNLQLLGYDGWDYDPSIDQDGSILSNRLNSLDSFGHEGVLVGMLTGKRVWEDMNSVNNKIKIK